MMLRRALPVSLAAVALFALFHGHAHGAEMPEAAQPLLYGLGFAFATALLHGAGVAVALSLRGVAREGKGGLVLRGLGAAIGLGGVALVTLA